MNFIYQHLPQRFYIHLPGVYEFYLRALVQRFYIHLNTLALALWILFPRNLFISLGAKAMKSTNMKNRVCAGRIFSWPCARKYYPSFSPNFAIFKVQGVCPMEKYSATLGLQPKNSVEFLGAEFVGDCKRINRTLATWTLSRYVLRQNHCQWVTNVPRHTTKPQTPRFSSHRSLFWTLPEQISILYPTCVATHPEPMSQDTPQNLRPQDFHLTHPCFEFCRNRSPYYTPHVCQPILNQCPKTHHKTSDPKIFISHIPVLNFARADLHIIPHMCANPSWTNVPRHTTKPQTLRFSSHTSLFWTLPEQISILYPTCVATHPEPMSQDGPQNLRP